MKRSLAARQLPVCGMARHFGAIWGLGMILGLQQDYQRAIGAFEKLLEIKPNSRDAGPRIEMLKQAMARESV